MKDEKGRFLKGHKPTFEEQKIISESIIKSWKNRSDYHGMYGTSFHTVWRSMITRCNGTAGKESIKKYKNKGITVCNEWKLFKNFYSDMFNSYSPGLTIDRIDNSKGYYKDNCRWATYKQQANNRTNNIFIEHKNCRLTLSQWADKLNIPFSKLRNRYHKVYSLGKCDIDYMFR